MVKTHAQPYKHIIHTNTSNSRSRRTAITRPTHWHAGQQQYNQLNPGNHLVSIHQMAPPKLGTVAHNRCQLTTQFIDPERMKGW